ncbi:MAG: ParB/RepB/Spo0J family partition protein [Candidatus Adiutrix sp.]|jgi:ParB family chromosome partitioning protein|nr:ParB/RepB/Spo0J family partition protein [Candidatus Adiutrix sp.]
MSTKKYRLGRGLDALLSSEDLDRLNDEVKAEDQSGQPLMLDVELLDHNPDQPRRDFNEKELQSLSQSIKARGVIEPLVVSRLENGRFEIIAGERRLKAAKMAFLNQVPVIIRKKSEDPADRLILALLENLCREDLNPIEEAESFQRLEKEFAKTHQEIAVMTGRERPTITNAVRLLKLPDFVRDDIRFGRLSAGHGRAMLALSRADLFHQLRTEIMTKRLSVRQTELLVKKMNRQTQFSKAGAQEGDQVYFEALAKAFSHKLGGLKVVIRQSGTTKKMEITYGSNEELEWLMNRLGVDSI